MCRRPLPFVGTGTGAMARAAAAIGVVTGVAIGVVTGVVVAAAPAAHGHGSLVVPTARIHADGSEVVVVWSAAEDDAVAVAAGAGLADPAAVDRYLDAIAALPADGDPQPALDELLASVDGSAIATDPRLAAALLEGISVSHDGQPCHGEVTRIEAFVREGAVLRFRCPPEAVDADRIATVDLTITLLTEQDPTHRTFSTDGAGDVRLHTAPDPTHRWRLPIDGAAGASTGEVLIVLIALALVVMAGGGVLWALRTPTGRPGRSRPPASPPASPPANPPLRDRR